MIRKYRGEESDGQENCGSKQERQSTSQHNNTIATGQLQLQTYEKSIAEESKEHNIIDRRKGERRGDGEEVVDCVFVLADGLEERNGTRRRAELHTIDTGIMIERVIQEE